LAGLVVPTASLPKTSEFGETPTGGRPPVSGIIALFDRDRDSQLSIRALAYWQQLGSDLQRISIEFAYWLERHSTLQIPRAVAQDWRKPSRSGPHRWAN